MTERQHDRSYVYIYCETLSIIFYLLCHESINPRLTRSEPQKLMIQTNLNFEILEVWQFNSWEQASCIP